jgi:RNA polymerase sigma factor (sigma-70 family)
MTDAAPEDAPDDLTLLRRYVKEGSEAAFTALVERHLGLVYAAALRQLQGAEHRAEEVAQSVFIALARQAHTLTRRQEILGWLYTSTHYAAAKLKRTEQRRAQREQEAHAMHELDTPAPEWDHLRPLLDEALLALPESDRAVILLRFFQQRRFADLGRQLGLSENTARMRLDRALEKLRAALGRRGVTSTAAGLGLVLANQPAIAVPASLAASVTGAALAGASMGGAATAAGVLIFMSTTKIITGVAVVAAVAAIGWGIYGQRERQNAADALAATTRERDSLKVEVQRVTARAREAEQKANSTPARVGPAPKSVEAPRIAESAAIAGPAEPMIGGGGGSGTPDYMKGRQLKEKGMVNPDFQRLMLQLEKAGMPLRYGMLYKSLGLTAQQAGEFDAALLEGKQSVADILAVANEKGVSLQDPAMVALAQEAKSRQDARLRTLLGDAGFQDYQIYERTSAMRDLTGRIAMSLAASETPPNFQQLNRVQQILAENNAGFQKGGAASGNERDINWDAVIEQARSVLSPSQLGVLQAMREQTRIAAQAEAFMRDLAKTQAAGSGAGEAMPQKP